MWHAIWDYLGKQFWILQLGERMVVRLLLSWQVSHGNLMLTGAKLASIFFFILLFSFSRIICKNSLWYKKERADITDLAKILFDCWYFGLKNFSIVEEFNSTPCSCWSPHCSPRYVYASQMNVAKPFSALIGVYIKVIYSAALVLTKVYTQTTTTAKTFTLINFLLIAECKNCRRPEPGAWKMFSVYGVVKQKIV